MASSSLTIKSNRGVIRKYGENRSDVRSMYKFYSNITLDKFLELHPKLNKSDYDSLQLIVKYNKN